MSKLAIIAARGGSKRIPRKNIRSFCGKPILLYSIEAALGSGRFDEVMVSTDDDEIAGIARAAGASVPFFRSAGASNDHATVGDVMEEVLAEYESRGTKYDIAATIYPTAPFVTAQHIAEAVERFENSTADTLVAVVPFSYPVQRAWVIRDEKLVFEFPEHLNSRSQDLEPHYHDAGQFYVFRTESFRRNRHLFLGEILPFPLTELEVQDIDTETDWELAELKYRLLHGGDTTSGKKAQR